MNKLTFGRQTIDPVLESVFARAGVYLSLELSNASQPRVGDARALVANDTALVQRSAEENLDYFYNDLNLDCIHNVLNLFFERKDLLTNDIKAIRGVCKMWQGMIDGTLFGCAGLLRQRFLVNLSTVKQLTAIIDRELSPKENISNTGLELDLISKFVVTRNLNIKLNLSNNDICPLVDQIMRLRSQSKCIEAISFGDVTKDNVIKIRSILGFISELEERCFLGLKKLIFGNCSEDLIFPNFKGLETLIFKDVWRRVVMANFPMLKNIEYGGGSEIYDLEQFEAALRLRGLSKIELRVGLSGTDILSNLLKFPGKESNLGCIETIVMNPVRKCDFWDVERSLKCIHSNQELLSGLKRIEIDNSVFTFEPKGLEPETIIAESLKLKVIELLTKLSEKVEIVYFTGSGARPVRKR